MRKNDDIINDDIINDILKKINTLLLKAQYKEAILFILEEKNIEINSDDIRKSIIKLFEKNIEINGDDIRKSIIKLFEKNIEINGDDIKKFIFELFEKNIEINGDDIKKFIFELLEKILELFNKNDEFFQKTPFDIEEINQNIGIMNMDIYDNYNNLYIKIDENPNYKNNKNMVLLLKNEFIRINKEIDKEEDYNTENYKKLNEYKKTITSLYKIYLIEYLDKFSNKINYLGEKNDYFQINKYLK